MAHVDYRRQSVWFRSLHALMVCMVLLGAVRSLVPGLCATATAANARAAEQAELRKAVPSCCAARMAQEAADPAFRVEHEAPPQVACAFCYLVMGLGHSIAQPAPVIVASATDHTPAAPPQAVRPALIAGAHPSRAPPVCA